MEERASFEFFKLLIDLRMRVDALENTLSFLPDSFLKQQEEAKARADKSKTKRSGRKVKGKKLHSAFIRADTAVDVNVFPCARLEELQVGLNTGEDGSCPVCQTDWNAFPSSSFACVLDCGHAFCLFDLCDNLKASVKVFYFFVNPCRASRRTIQSKGTIRNSIVLVVVVISMYHSLRFLLDSLLRTD
jgi:hypothetical protein